VDKAVKNIADDNHLTAEQIVTTNTQAGVSADTFRQQLAAQLVWQKLVAARYGTDVLINEQKVDEAMDRLKKGADKPQFLVSEIFLAVDRPEDDAAIRTSANQIAEQIKQGAPFTAVAGQFSQSPSAADGGDIGWVVQGQLPEELDHALADLHPGDLAGPLRAERATLSKQLQGSVFNDLGKVDLKELAPELRDGVTKTPPGEVVEPYFSPAGLEIIMRCDPVPPKLVAFQLPSRDQLQQQLFVQQMSILGKSYLRDLRRDAVVETR